MNYKVPKDEIKLRLDEFHNLFRESGFKITPQREEIYKVLLESSSHPSVDLIFEKVKSKFPNISLDTVYRNVESLEQANLVNRIVGIGGKNHYEVNIEPHHHFICSKCHTIYDFTYAKANTEQINLPQNAIQLGKIESTHLIIKGICKKCNSK
ncbi:MAG TPA: Fur family transcriptional regulator [Leptospiraceae bacterium]|nr:Fur family transcriptional regulator [Leptospiraceae bacterium]HMW04477.1 Fur family transcriptional regulator [Leptospiraceae bacterium]HMX31135.1 Fur family transcriptional regulator [Leptospiraceae bacterium]HMY30663.1 Fur family transcriptional regulator [Leptospiraceae bacterium]HMZ65804.1 Fur family transcriptional regulator [Leptospiraceae bacterium]